MKTHKAYEIKGLPWETGAPPRNWEVSPLDEILVSLNSGFACGRGRQVEKGLVHLRPMNISSAGRIDLSDCRYVPPGVGDRRLKLGDVLFNNTNSPVWVGKTAWISPEFEGLAFSNHMTRLRMSEGVNTRFIAQQIDWLRRCSYFEINCNKHVNQASISGDFLRHKTPILIPPLAEQKRIADKLEAVLGRVDACRARLDRVPALLKRFRQSVLAAAVSGQLTEDWRTLCAANARGFDANNTNQLNEKYFVPEGWEVATVADLSTMITSGSRGWADYYSTDGAMFIRAQNINTDRLDLEDVAHVSLPDKAEGKRAVVKRNDLLITITGANVGKSARVPLDLEEAYISQHIALVKLRDSKLAAFVELFLWAENAGRGQLNKAAYGGGKPGLNLQNIRELSIGVPPLPEQQEIVRRVDNLFAFAARIEARLATLQKTVERLTPATLAKAFRGELVPQDPNDEPARILLERIKGGLSQLTQKNRVKAEQTAKIPKPLKKRNFMSKSRFDEDVKGKPYLAALIGGPQYAETAEQLFLRAQLSMVDFYKQLSWEVEQGMIKENGKELEGT